MKKQVLIKHQVRNGSVRIAYVRTHALTHCDGKSTSTSTSLD